MNRWLRVYGPLPRSTVAALVSAMLLCWQHQPLMAHARRLESPWLLLLVLICLGPPDHSHLHPLSSYQRMMSTPLCPC